MPPIHLDSLGDPRVAEYRDVREPDMIRERGLFVAEGRLVVQRVIDERRYAVRSLLVSEAARQALDSSIARLDHTVPVYVCAADQFVEMTGFHVHRGCLALVERPLPATIDEVIGSERFVIVLEGVGNADNVGGVFRCAAAFDVGGVLLSPGCCDPLYRKAIRTSMAATLQIPFARIDPWPGGLAAVRRLGFSIVALTPRSPSEPLDSFARRGMCDRVALVIGTESIGLSEEVETSADYRVRIPISRAVDSLNLAVATGIALSRLTRLDHLE